LFNNSSGGDGSGGGSSNSFVHLQRVMTLTSPAICLEVRHLHDVQQPCRLLVWLED